MVFWQKFDPEQFDFEFDEEELAGHEVAVDEAVEIIWNGFDVHRNRAITAATNSSGGRTAAEDSS